MRRSAAVGSVDRDAQRVAHQGGKGQSWSDRMLGRQQLGLAFVIGALIGASYILGLKQLVQSNDGLVQVVRAPALPDPVLGGGHQTGDSTYDPEDYPADLNRRLLPGRSIDHLALLRG